MKTNGHFVSRVSQGLKALTKDGRVSNRYILTIGRDKARYLMAQKLDEMTLFKEEGIITHIPCVEFIEESVKSCDIFEFKRCHSLMRSKEKLPEGIFGKNGSGIVSVTSVDAGKDYDYITPRRFAGLSKRKYVIRDSRFYYVRDGYLYLPNSTTELLDIDMIALDKSSADMVSSCKESSFCESHWDLDFICPDRFFDLVVQDTIQEVANFYRTSIPDTNPNLDENQKQKTVQ